MSFINFKPEEFSYLNITSVGLEHVQNGTECGFACLRITSCFSYNLAAFSDLSEKLLCELLPSDKFNNSDKFTISPLYHHFSIPVSTNWIMLLLFFQEDQRFSQNSLRSALTFTRGSLCMVFYCSEPAGKVHRLSCSDSDEVMWRKDPIRRMSRGNAMVFRRKLFKHIYG